MEEGLVFVPMKGKKKISVDTENHFKGASPNLESLEFEVDVWQNSLRQVQFTSFFLILSEYSFLYPPQMLCSLIVPKCEK